MPIVTVEELRKRCKVRDYRFVPASYNPPDRYFAIITDAAVIAETKHAFERIVAGGGPGADTWRQVAPSEINTMLVLHDVR